ncbi:MAG: hypothetical protein IIB36_08985 [Gemmatimonadetes bacterium]|nr:hypothetical protein [Gemmatimonadota bacterium]
MKSYVIGRERKSWVLRRSGSLDQMFTDEELVAVREHAVRTTPRVGALHASDTWRGPRRVGARAPRWPVGSGGDREHPLYNALFPHNCIHIENMGGEISSPELQNQRLTIGCFPWKFKGGEAAFARTVAFVGEFPS